MLISSRCDQNNYKDAAIWKIDQKNAKGKFQKTSITLEADTINFELPKDDGNGNI